MEKTSSAKASSMGVKKILVPVLALLTILFAASSVYLFLEVKKLKNDPQIVAREEVKELLDEVGKLIVLPTDEVPTIATVTDPEQLKTQAFFSKAQKDDKVLLYTNAKKAILYRPSTKQIVEVAPINIGAPAEGTEPAPAPTPETP